MANPTNHGNRPQPGQGQPKAPGADIPPPPPAPPGPQGSAAPQQEPAGEIKVTSFVNTPSVNIDELTAKLAQKEAENALLKSELESAKKRAEHYNQGNATGGLPGWYKVCLEEQKKDGEAYFTDHVLASDHPSAILKYCELKGIQIDEGRPNTKSSIITEYVGTDLPPIAVMKLKYTVLELEEFGYPAELADKWGRAMPIVRDTLDDIDADRRRLDMAEERILREKERSLRLREKNQLQKA